MWNGGVTGGSQCPASAGEPALILETDQAEVVSQEVFPFLV